MPSSVFVITNRNFEKTGNSYKLRNTINQKGSRELRMFEANRSSPNSDKWELQIIPDSVNSKTLHNIAGENLWPKLPKYSGSHLVATELVKRLRTNRSNLVFLVHGYNNNVYDALQRAESIANRYNVEVVVFSWPSNGGGDSALRKIHGKVSYKLDKADARGSTAALDYALAKMHQLLMQLNDGVLKGIQDQVANESSSSRETDRIRMATLLKEKACPFNVTLITHSMGNYLYKNMLLSSSERLSKNVVFDNVILKSADTNHADHARWVEKIRARHRVYVTINQDDFALTLSNLKIGDSQKPRLGSTIGEQNANNTVYIDFTNSLGKEHSYFLESDLSENSSSAEAAKLSYFFEKAFNGEIAEEHLKYYPQANTYRIM
ncbi:MAG: alpha/beta hydrolase [Opitutaceae bacterium]